ncbi:MAG: D-glycerate dehydrogenase [Dethiobacter sp.]|jgi:glyoxylate reductase|nr:D-glycerate dehydrogenase [Dethiobacter sp.]
MKKPKVYVTRRLPQKALDMIAAECEMQVNPYDRVMTRQELEEAIKEVDGILCLLTDSIDASLLNLNPNLKVLANYAVGFNNIDVAACTQRRIAVSNTPGVLTETSADLAWALIMTVARRIVEADRFTREGKFDGWGPMMFLGGDVCGKTLGVVGMGRIGQAVVRRAKGFDMKVIYYNTNRKSEAEENALGVEYRELDSLLQEADFVSLHVPLMDETVHLIGEGELKVMKNTAYLINTARGPVVDEKALVKALREGEIAGAGLDVFEQEPELEEGLASLDNVVILPHIASASTDTRTKMAMMAAENLLAGLKGEKMPNIINPEVLK